jgi:hypothetical protein
MPVLKPVSKSARSGLSASRIVVTSSAATGNAIEDLICLGGGGGGASGAGAGATNAAATSAAAVASASAPSACGVMATGVGAGASVTDISAMSSREGM